MILHVLRSVWRDEVLSYRYGKEVVLLVLVAGVSFGGYQGYAWHRSNQEKNAQYAMAEAIEELDKANYYLLDPKSQNIPLAEQYLKDAQLAFDVMNGTYSSSKLYPYACAFQADIALRQGDVSSALQLLDTALSKMSVKDKLYGMLQIKKALVLIDTNNAETGIASLEKYAFDKKNPHADTAAFYLGYYYFVNNNKNDAIRVWSELVQSMKAFDKKSEKSPWLLLVEDKLEQLGA